MERQYKAVEKIKLLEKIKNSKNKKIVEEMQRDYEGLARYESQKQ